MGGNIEIINLVLSAVPLYQSSIYRLLKSVKRKIDQIRRKFLWRGVRHEKKVYNLIKWELVFRSKKQGGLAISQLDQMNTTLLMKWWWRLVNTPDETVCNFLREKYGNREIAWNLRAGIIINKNSSHVWKGLSK